MLWLHTEHTEERWIKGGGASKVWLQHAQRVATPSTRHRAIRQQGNKTQKKKTVRQRNLPEDLRERGVAVIRPKGQNSSRVRGGWEESVTERGRRVWKAREEEGSGGEGGVNRKEYVELVGKC